MRETEEQSRRGDGADWVRVVAEEIPTGQEEAGEGHCQGGEGAESIGGWRWRRKWESENDDAEQIIQGRGEQRKIESCALCASSQSSNR